jgi:segregation and condensation protein B
MPIDDEQQPPASDDTAAPESEVPEPSMTVDAVMESGPAAQPVSEQLVAVLEALVFASPEPITPKQIFKLLDAEPKEDVQAALAELEARYEARGGGLQLVQVAGGYQIVTRPELAEWVRRMFHERTTQKLSVQALETLAVIAYKQPITAAEITEIRAVNTSGVIGTLLERGLVKISGRKQVVGRPFLYSTTREFLDRFGLRDLSDLPKVEDMAGALGFEPPVGLATEAVDTLPLSDEPATEDDVAVLTGEGGEADAADGSDETIE